MRLCAWKALLSLLLVAPPLAVAEAWEVDYSSHIREVARVDLTTGAKFVVEQDDYVYVSTRHDGLLVFDASDPLSLQLVGTAPAETWFEDLILRGDVLYAAERWRGEVEPYDPPGGRIAGARNVPLAENLDDGRFKTAEALRKQYAAFLGDVPPERLVVSCGSGITACHTLLALERAGLGGGALYVGSYSEWSRQGRATERGEP